MIVRLSRLIREGLPIVLVAIVVFQLLRLHVAERYLVPSRSMEPTLYGHPTDGDRVLVLKVGSGRWWRPAPLDLVVLRDEDAKNDVVKRLIAIAPPDAALNLRIRDGDVFTSRDDPAKGNWQRVVKDPIADRDLQVTQAALDSGASQAEWLEFVHRDDARWSHRDGALTLRAATGLLDALSVEAREARLAALPPDPYLPGYASTEKPIDTSFLDSRGQSLAPFRGFPRDIGFELGLTLDAAATSVVFVYEERETYYSLDIDPAGVARLRVDGVPSGDPVTLTPLPLGVPITVEFGYLDGHVFLIVDGERRVYRELELPDDARVKLPDLPERPRFGNLLHLGVTGGEATIHGLRLFHDVHYSGDRQPYRLPPGCIFVLGDNTFDSEDSRGRDHDPYRLDDIVGRPVAVIGPWERMRWLVRSPTAAADR